MPGLNAPGKGHFGILLCDGSRDVPLFRDGGRRDRFNDADLAGVLREGVELARKFFRFEMAMYVYEAHGNPAT